MPKITFIGAGSTVFAKNIFRALRTIPVVLAFARDLEKVSPNAWFLNYVNPAIKKKAAEGLAILRKKDYIYQAAMLDPHTAAELTLDEIKSMCDDLIKAHGKYLPAYR
jgi:alpha-galactosidase/6-phospho-beta-glucosidase family protein